MNYLFKFSGEGSSIKNKIDLFDVLFSSLGALIAMLVLTYLTKSYSSLLVMGSFGASCVLLFAYEKSPFSQPRNVIGGHFISTLTALVFLHFIGDMWWVMALALSTAIFLMLLTRTVHPPAGSNPIIVFLLSSSWDYLFFPSLFGSILLVLVALFYINLHKKKSYPLTWY